MGLKTDRTTKFLLLVIATLLAALVLRPLWPTSRAVAAESTTTTSTDTQTETRRYGYRLTEVGNITVPRGVIVREMEVVDSAQSFVVRMDDKINVYRIDRFLLPINTAK